MAGTFEPQRESIQSPLKSGEVSHKRTFKVHEKARGGEGAEKGHQGD